AVQRPFQHRLRLGHVGHAQVAAGGHRETEILRLDLVLAHHAVAQFADQGSRAQRDLVCPVAAPHHQRAARAQLLQHTHLDATRSGWNTPIRMLGAPAGLVSGPRMLNRVRTPISLRTGATTFMAGWWFGANMKPMPVSARHSATCAGARSMRAPSASSTSALPDFDDTLRPPCLAMRAPAAAATNIEAVEMLKLEAPSPPVPT